MKYLALLDFLCLLLAAQTHKSAGLCEFPREWHGSWYQSVVGDVTVTNTQIDKKGVCVERQNDFFLLENKEIGCYTCLLFHKKHEHILQYQESFCVGKETLYNTCNQIQPATLMHTLIREPNVPSPCPFQEAFHFTYNNNTGGFCRDPASYAKACASDSKFRLHFKHCHNAVYTYHRDVDLHCLGSWQDAGQMYMVGKLSGPGLVVKEHMYRCFIYQALGTLMYVSMSADASCRGLITPRNGPLVMEMTKDHFGWPEPSCPFPAWVSKTTWRDLSGHHVYQASAPGSVVHYSYRHRVTDNPDVHKAFRCVRVLEQNTTKDTFVAMSFTSHGCNAKYQCIRLVKRKRGVIELHEGKYSQYGTEACWSSHLDNSTKSLLIPEAVEETECPHPGRYQIHTGSSMCDSYFRSGCNGTSIIDIVSTCSSKPGLQLECIKTWREGKTSFVVARRPDKHDGMTNCFSFREKGDSLHFSADEQCNIGTPYIMRDAVTYVMDNKPLDCEFERRLTGKTATADEQIDDEPGREDEGGGGTMRHPDSTKQQQDDPAAVMEGSYKHIDDGGPSLDRDHRTAPHSHAVRVTYTKLQTVAALILCACATLLVTCDFRYTLR